MFQPNTQLSASYPKWRDRNKGVYAKCVGVGRMESKVEPMANNNIDFTSENENFAPELWFILTFPRWSQQIPLNYRKQI